MRPLSEARRLIAALAGAAVGLAGMAAAGQGEAAAASPGMADAAPAATPWDVSFDPNDKESARKAYQTYYKATSSTRPGWTGSVTGCVPGTASKAWRDQSIRAINYFRHYNKLPGLIEAKSPNAQAAALMMEASGRSVGIRTSAWTCSTPVGIDLPTDDGFGGPAFWEFALWHGKAMSPAETIQAIVYNG